MSLDEARKNRELVRVYREAFTWDKKDGVGASQKRMLEDIEQFCGLRQAKFTGTEADMIKSLGRVEVLGRINFFLNFPDDELRIIDEAITRDEETRK